MFANFITIVNGNVTYIILKYYKIKFIVWGPDHLDKTVYSFRSIFIKQAYDNYSPQVSILDLGIRSTLFFL